MTREKAEELREQLLRNENVQRMIQMRAYEIYQQRGGRPGNPAEDWLRAESEVLAYLIEEESKRNEEAQSERERLAPEREHGAQAAPSMGEERAEGPRTLALPSTPETADRAAGAAPQTARERAESEGVLGAWSAAGPPSSEPAPELGSSPEQPKQKKAGSQPAKTRKAKGADGGLTAEAIGKKAASKSGGKKSTSKGPAGKKSASAKPRKSGE